MRKIKIKLVKFVPNTYVSESVAAPGTYADRLYYLADQRLLRLESGGVVTLFPQERIVSMVAEVDPDGELV